MHTENKNQECTKLLEVTRILISATCFYTFSFTQDKQDIKTLISSNVTDYQYDLSYALILE